MTPPNRNDDRESQTRGVLPTRQRHETTEAVDPADVLDRLRVLEVYEWSSGGRIGPAAEDFHTVFGAGDDADSIATGDPDGVSMAAIQGLADRVDEQNGRIERQEQQIEQQRELIDDQRDDIETLRERVESLQTELSRLRRE